MEPIMEGVVMDFEPLLSEHAPRVATRSPELAAALGDLCDRVVTTTTRPHPRPPLRRTRTAVIGLTMATAVGIGGAAAADLPWHFPWDPGTDSKTFRAADGTNCELAFTVSAGVDNGGDMDEARRVAKEMLTQFQLDPDLLPPHPYSDPNDEAHAYVVLAAKSVNDSLVAEGLPAVTIQAETACEQGNQ